MLVSMEDSADKLKQVYNYLVLSLLEATKVLWAQRTCSGPKSGKI